MRNRNLLSLVGLLAALMLVVAACGDDDDAADGDAEIEAGMLDGLSVTVGSKDFDEQLVLGYISVTALQEAGAEVTDEVDLGGTDAARDALVNGNIDHYWEYNGTAWISFFGETEPIQDRIEQYEVVRDRDLEENGLVWLTPSEFNNTYALAYQRDFGDELGNPETLSDLGPIIEDTPELATLCVESEFPARDDGLPGMEATYGYTFPSENVTVMDTGLVYTSTADGDPCYFGEIFTTDGRVAALDLVVLEDDEAFFPLYNASAVFREDVYNDFADELDSIYEPIAEALDNDTMADLNAQVSDEGQRPETVAENWLRDNGFIE